jgi:hypothetical protein
METFEQPGVRTDIPDDLMSFLRPSVDLRDMPEGGLVIVANQLFVCIQEGGSYSIADSISVIEGNTGALNLDTARRETLIDLINRVEGATDEWSRYVARCELVGSMIGMVVDCEEPNLSLAGMLFNFTGNLVTEAAMRPARRKRGAARQIASDILRYYLEEACTSLDSLGTVIKFTRQLKESSAGSREQYGVEFLKYFVNKGLANF